MLSKKQGFEKLVKVTMNNGAVAAHNEWQNSYNSGLEVWQNKINGIMKEYNVAKK
ncbi:hypothetical protein [Pectinatus brassicae]|uniref:Uncharacterized protein n=1 Tax=Pectinatus brassicae TaxID=862415 RepID=A0A840UKQ7_9FIRM|nr:hypothetical protein [Pectinatus brassicae]MBB5336277.1 hypothetical protein [Pectinatus brassicae]